MVLTLYEKDLMKTYSRCIMVSKFKHRMVKLIYLVLLFHYVVTPLHNMSLLDSRKGLVLHTVSVGIVNVPQRKCRFILMNNIFLKGLWKSMLDSALK